MDTATHCDASGPVARFGPFTLDARRAELHRHGEAIALRPKTFALLSYFVGHPGRVISKDELLGAVWPGVVVNDESLSQCVRELRGALGDGGQALIRTVPRRGYLFDAPIEESTRPPAAGSTRPSRRRWAWPATAAAMLMLALVLLLAVATPPGEAPALADDAIRLRRSVAVLPFTDAGGDQGRVAGALTAGVVTALAKVPDTLVIAGGAPAPAPANAESGRNGREPKPRHRLTGTAQQDRERIRVHVQLESVDDAAVSWSELFEHADPSDEAWQQDLALRIARAVDRRMSLAAASRTTPERPDPVDELIRGLDVLRSAARYDDLVRARAHFEAVTAVQPGSAAAWTGLAQSYVSEFEAPWNLGRTSAVLAEQALARARAADPHYLPAQYVAAGLLAVRDDPEGALRVYQAVAAANPSDPWAHAQIGAMQLRLGRLTEVQGPVAAALRLAPDERSLVAFSHLQAGLADFYLGRDASAYEHARQSVAAGPSPTQLQAMLMLASLEALHGRGQEAREWSGEVLRLRPRFSVGAWRVWTAPVHPRLQVLRDRYLEGLARAGLPE